VRVPEEAAVSSPGEFRIDESSGSVWVTHVPTGIVTTASGYGSEAANRDAAMAAMVERLTTPCTMRRPHWGPHQWWRVADGRPEQRQCPGLAAVVAEFADFRQVQTVRCYLGSADGVACTRLLAFDRGDGLVAADLRGWTLSDRPVGLPGVGDRLWVCPEHRDAANRDAAVQAAAASRDVAR
jgi:hypothetical protein